MLQALEKGAKIKTAEDFSNHYRRKDDRFVLRIASVNRDRQGVRCREAANIGPSFSLPLIQP